MNPFSDQEIWVIIPAAGVGQRMQSDRPKQYLPLLSTTLIEVTVQKLVDLSFVSGVVVALGEKDPYWSAQSISCHAKVHTCTGGAERSDSVSNGLTYLEHHLLDNIHSTWVMVHDAARPCVSTAKLEELASFVIHHKQGAILAVPCSDTVKRVNHSPTISHTEDRSSLWLAHTPQMFAFSELKHALTECKEKAVPVTDEASAVEAVGGVANVVQDRRDNIKVTLPEDLSWAEQILKNQQKELNT